MRVARFRLVVVAAVVAILCASCKADTKSPEASSSTSAQVSSSTDPRSASERAKDTTLAEAALLRLSDFPPGWQADTTGQNDDSSNDTTELDACLGRDKEDNPRAESPDFISSDDDKVSELIAVKSSVDAAQNALNTYRQRKAASCYQTAMQKIAEKAFEKSVAENKDELKGAKVGDVSFNELSFSKLGDDLIAFRVTVPVSAEGQTASFYFDTVVVRVGRFTVSMNFTAGSVESPFDVDEAQRLVTAAVAKLAQVSTPAGG